MELLPLYDRIILKPETSQVDKKGAIYMPKDKSEQQNIATVIAIGANKSINGKEFLATVKVGDKVLYNKYASLAFEIDNETMLITKETDLIAIIKG